MSQFKTFKDENGLYGVVNESFLIYEAEFPKAVAKRIAEIESEFATDGVEITFGLIKQILKREGLSL